MNPASAGTSAEMTAVGWECVVCGATRRIEEAFPWRCPNSSVLDRHHLLRLRSRDPWARETAEGASADEVNPFIRYDRRLAWAAFAEAHGMGTDGRRQLVGELDSSIAAVDGHGFALTPFARSDALSDALGFSTRGGIWVKDETHAVGGSQKARHLMSILLHLLAAESFGMLADRPPLAIASCGNAAIAAATLARAAAWPIDVYVPVWMSAEVGERLDRLGAHVHRCERSATSPPGDPAMFGFRDAVERGSIPFTVQGPENALCLDGGRTIGWETVEQANSAAVALDRMFAQVGGGALASCLGDGLRDADRPVTFHAVQAEGAAPLPAAWERAGGASGVAAGVAQDALRSLAGRWSEIMLVWSDPRSLADGILDDETYDWLGVFDAMSATGGSPVVASERDVEQAHAMATEAGFDVSATGSAGLAGVAALRSRLDDDERIGVVMSGIAR